jgi:hypothetical protein
MVIAMSGIPFKIKLPLFKQALQSREFLEKLFI